MTASLTTVKRGATVQFATNFYDINGDLTQPTGALVNIVYQTPTPGTEANTQLTMVAPVDPETRWTAKWDTREVGPGLVYWSIHTVESGIPFAVEDGNFMIEANLANLATF